MNSIVIGIDISKQKFDSSFSVDQKKWHHQVFNNTSQGFKEFLEWISKNNISLFHGVMEATGRYGESLAEFLYENGHRVSILNPVQIRYYSKSCLTRSKTDKVDSKLIAEFASKHETKSWKPLSSEMKKLKALERCLDSFKQDKTQISNRLEQERDKDVRKLLEERKALIEQQIETVEAALKKLLTAPGEIKTSVALLESIPGIGITTAMTLLGELPDLSTFESAKQLSAYAGLNPSVRSSGSSVRGKSCLSKVGSSSLRKTLYFPAMTAMRYNHPLKEFAEKLKEKGKKPMVIIGAVMRKLLHIIFGVLKKQQTFQVFSHISEN